MILISSVVGSSLVNIDKIDLNLLVYLDVLLRERNVTKAAHQLSISQPAMSNALRRLRELLDDPILVRTSEGMTPTERAEELQPVIRQALSGLEKALQPQTPFETGTSDRVFRIMASDYAESALIPPLMSRLRDVAPQITLDIMTPSDVSFLDVEQGKVDMVINRFDNIPLSFHQKSVWNDHFLCVFNANHPLAESYDLETYLEANHVWVSKTGWGAGVGIDPLDVQRLGWVDEALNQLGKSRRIRIFTRHYQAALMLADQDDLVVTIPSRATILQQHNPNIILRSPPFEIPEIELKMAWSPLLQHNLGHQWLRRLIADVARDIKPVIPTTY